VKVNATFDGGSRRGPSPRNYDYSIHYVNAPWPFAVGQIPVPARKPLSKRRLPTADLIGGRNQHPHSAPGIRQRAEIRSIYKKEKSKTGQRVAAIIEGKIMNLSIEAKVAIAVATGLVVLIVGAMAQG